MEFKTHNDIEIHSLGGLLDYVDVTYDDLLRTFGSPHTGDEYKVDAEWDIQFEDGRIVSIYNYKDGKNYLGRKGTSVENIYKWHIGGKDRSVIKDVKEIISNSSIRFKDLEKYKNIINTPTQDEWDIMFDCIERYRDMIHKRKTIKKHNIYVNKFILMNQFLMSINQNVMTAFGELNVED